MTTTTEVRDYLAARYPRRTFAVSETAWIHGLGLTGEKYVEYVIGVQPGFNGTECQNFSDDSFKACLEKLEQAAPPRSEEEIIDQATRQLQDSIVEKPKD